MILFSKYSFRSEQIRVIKVFVRDCDDELPLVGVHFNRLGVQRHHLSQSCGDPHPHPHHLHRHQAHHDDWSQQGCPPPRQTSHHRAPPLLPPHQQVMKNSEIVSKLLFKSCLSQFATETFTQRSLPALC